MLSALTLAPQRCRLGLYWAMRQRNIRAAELAQFVRLLQRHLRRDLTLVMDRWSVHRAARVRTFLTRHARSIRVEWLPSYAPDLNPVEQVWNHTKYGDLANVAPADLDDLDEVIDSSIRHMRTQARLLRVAFATAQLSL